MSENISLNAEFPKDGLSRFRFAVRLVAWADDIGPVVREELRKAAPIRQGSLITGGRLRQSIRYQRAFTPSGGSVKWTSNVPYAGYVIGGTRPHEIHAKSTRAMRFMDKGGGIAFRRHVRHPGSKPNDFPKRVAGAMESRIYESFRRHITEGL